jgi:short-subunit dehydrogenase
MVQHSKEIKGRTALITGASKLGDIGAAIAQCYAAQGANVIIAARSQDGLDEVRH